MQRRWTLSALALAVTCSLAAAGDWPQWRGPDRTDVSTEKNLLKSWPEGGPKKVWLFQDAGIGYSSVAVVKGKVYTMGGRDGKEQLLCIDAAKGTPLWFAEIGSVLSNNWGDGPRGTPTVDGDFVYAMGGQGNLICVETGTGKIAWHKSMKDLGGGTPGWGYTESVLIDGDKVVCTPGGKKGAVAALNKKTGEIVWQSADFTDGAQYASIITAEHGGKRQYIQLTMKTLVGLDAENGKVLWKSNWPGQTAVIPTPIFKDGHVYVSSGYGVGCKLVKIDDDFKASDVYANKTMTNHHGGVILVGDHLYGYSDGKGWVCQDFKTGEMTWNEKGKLGKGAIACADGMLYLLDEATGAVALIEASAAGYSEKGRFKLDPQTKLRKPSGRIWSHPVISGGKLYLRDQELLFCFDVASSTN